MYSIKEIYYTIQGEGYHTGQSAVFLRFSGCNLWSGLEKDRETAICRFCDTDFWATDGTNGGKYSAIDLVDKCVSLWPPGISEGPFIVCTGGEPLLQLDKTLIDELHNRNCFIAIESNGTITVPEGVDWICISPKVNAKLIVDRGDELKLVYPQEGISLENYEMLDFNHYSLQPLDNADQEANIKLCVDICKRNPKWKLSLQTHKLINIP